MKKILKLIVDCNPKPDRYNFAIFLFRTVIAIDLIVVHGLKKIGIGVPVAEIPPNPMNLPVTLNSIIITTSIMFLPFLIIIGLFTRLAAFCVFCVTSIGYLIVHGNDSASIRENPLLFSMAMLLLVMLGSGKYSVDYYIENKINKRRR